MVSGFASLMQGGTAIAGAVSQSNAMGLQGDYTKQQSDWNASIANLQGADAVRRGQVQAEQSGTRTQQLIGTIRNQAGAQGVDVNTGTAKDLQEDAAGLGALDALTIRNNAYREAFGYQVKALSDTAAGNWGQLTGRNNANSTLLLGGMNSAAFATKGVGYFMKSGGGGADSDSEIRGSSASDYTNLP